jgi:hypothetical protein
VLLYRSSKRKEMWRSGGLREVRMVKVDKFLAFFAMVTAPPLATMTRVRGSSLMGKPWQLGSSRQESIVRLLFVVSATSPLRTC